MTPGAGTIRVFVVDDHEIVRRGLIDLLQAPGGLMVVGEAGSAAAATARIPAAEPDVVLLDVRLPDGNGVEVCEAVRRLCPGAKVLMLTSFADAGYERDAARAGASGYLLKDIHSDALLDAIIRAHRGDVVTTPAVPSGSADGTTHNPSLAGWNRLSPQERRVLGHLGSGLTNHQIAEAMFLSDRTVDHYVSAVLGKLGLDRRTQAAAYITRLQDQGLVPTVT